METEIYTRIYEFITGVGKMKRKRKPYALETVGIEEDHKNKQYRSIIERILGRLRNGGGGKECRGLGLLYSACCGKGCSGDYGRRREGEGRYCM